MSTDADTGRAETIDRIRQLADVLEHHPDLPIPHALTVPLLLFPNCTITELGYLLGGPLHDTPWNCRIDPNDKDFPLHITGTLAGFPVEIYIRRNTIGLYPETLTERLQVAAENAFPYAATFEVGS